MSARTIRRPRNVLISVEALAEHDPGFAATDAVLLGMGWTRDKVSPLRRRRDGQLSGRIVWRKGGRTVVWSAHFDQMMLRDA